MKRNLISTGNGWDLYMPKPILKLTGFVPKKDKLLLTIENSELVITKINPSDIDKYKNNFVKNLAKCGSGWSLYLPLTVLELLEINPETDLVSYKINGQILTIKKAE